eukprot:354128-Chlamydomonas_euryale.AAC.2
MWRGVVWYEYIGRKHLQGGCVGSAPGISGGENPGTMLRPACLLTRCHAVHTCVGMRWERTGYELRRESWHDAAPSLPADALPRRPHLRARAPQTASCARAPSFPSSASSSTSLSRCGVSGGGPGSRATDVMQHSSLPMECMRPADVGSGFGSLRVWGWDSVVWAVERVDLKRAWECRPLSTTEAYTPRLASKSALALFSLRVWYAVLSAMERVGGAHVVDGKGAWRTRR